MGFKHKINYQGICLSLYVDLISELLILSTLSQLYKIVYCKNTATYSQDKGPILKF